MAAAIMAPQVAIVGPAAITATEAITGMAAITGMEIIMGTAGTTGMEIGIASVLRSARDGADGGQGGGVLQPTRIIRLHQLLSNNSLRCMFSRISRIQVIGTTAKIPRATTQTSNPVRAAG